MDYELRFFNLKTILIFIFQLIFIVNCKQYSSSNNSLNDRENFKYNLPELSSNSITNIEILKESSCGCPPKGNFSQSNLSKNQDKPCNFNLGVEAKYQCELGYVEVSGNKVLRCEKNYERADWSGTPLNCEQLLCEDPGEVEHAIKINTTSIYAFKSKIEYKCLPTHTPDSVPFLHCNKNGKWNRKKPTCKIIQCPLLKDLDQNLFIQYNDTDRKINSVVKFICKQGYHLEANYTNRVCGWDGNWSGRNPVCLPSFCEKPSIDGLIFSPNKDKYSFGEKISFKCSQLKKEQLAECMLDGYFKGLPNECSKPKKTHCNSIEIMNGQVSSSAQDKFMIGARLSFKCDYNFILSQEIEIFCLFNGEWSNKHPICLDLSTIKNSQTLSYILTCIIIIIFLIISITLVLLFRWRQKQLQRRQWQRYFCNSDYLLDKKRVQTNLSQEMHILQSQRICVPFTDL